MQSKINKNLRLLIGASFAVIVLVLLLLSASNYPVQWRRIVNLERQKYLEVYAQAIEYRYLDHGELPNLPRTVSVISNSDTCVAYCAHLSTEIPCWNSEGVLVPTYMKEILQDPLLTSDTDSGFYIEQLDDMSFRVGACNYFFNESIELSRTVSAK